MARRWPQSVGPITAPDHSTALSQPCWLHEGIRSKNLIILYFRLVPARSSKYRGWHRLVLKLPVKVRQRRWPNNINGFETSILNRLLHKANIGLSETVSRGWIEELTWHPVQGGSGARRECSSRQGWDKDRPTRASHHCQWVGIPYITAGSSTRIPLDNVTRKIFQSLVRYLQNLSTAL